MSNKLETDVLIVGAGMAGCALAFALAKYCRVTILEKQTDTWSQDRIGESLPAAALRSLTELGLSDAINQPAHTAYHGVVSVWGQSTPVHKDFFESLDGSGLHVDRGALNRAIKNKAIEAGVNVVHEAQLVSLARTSDRKGWAIEYQIGDTRANLTAKFVVDASGRAGIVTRKLGLKRRNIDRAVAIHTKLSSIDAKKFQQPETDFKPKYNGTTLIEAVEHGWWYRAPLPNGDCIVSFHTDSDLPAARIMQSADQWLAAFYGITLISHSLAEPQSDTPTKSRAVDLNVCAANTSAPQTSAGDGWLALGDAAIAFDPLSSQGMFNALTTALMAKSCIQKSLAGDDSATKRYADQLKVVNNAYLANLTHFYQAENRWPESPFWRRRRFAGSQLNVVS